MSELSGNAMDWLLIAARTFHFAATISLTGVFAWECLVAGPASHSPALVAISAALHRRLGWLAWASLAVALVSGAAWLAATATEMSGKPLGAVLSEGTGQWC